MSPKCLEPDSSGGVSCGCRAKSLVPILSRQRFRQGSQPTGSTCVYLCWLGLLLLLMVWPRLGWGAGTAEVHYAKGILAFDSREYVEAMALFRQTLALTPNNPHAHFYLGLSLSRTGELAAAIQELETALNLDPGLTYVHRPLANALLQVKRYNRALAHFRLAATVEPERAETHFYLGYTHLQLSDYAQAPPFFQRASELEPKLMPQAQYYKGLALFKSERDKPAREAFQTVIASAPQSGSANLAQRYLEAIERRAPMQQLLQFKGSLTLEYDDNVILEPNEIEIARQGDGRTIFAMTAKLLPLRTSTWRAGVEYALFQSLHFDLHEFNVQNHTGRLFARLKLPSVTFYSTADYTYTLLDNQRFSETISVQPTATVEQSKSFFLTALMRYSYSNFFRRVASEPDPSVRNRDGWALRMGPTQYLRFNQNRALVSAGYHFELSRNDGSDWEYDGHQIDLNLYTPLYWGIKLQAGGGYRRRDYRHVHSFAAEPIAILTADDRRKRRDDTLTVTLDVSRALGKSLRLALAYVHTENMSNIAFFDFRRNIVSLTLSGRY